MKRVAIPSWSAETATWGDNSIVVSVDQDGDVEFDLSGSLAGRSFIVDSRELCDALRKLGVIPDDQPAAEPGEYPRYEVDAETFGRRTRYVIFRRSSDRQRWGCGMSYADEATARAVADMLNILRYRESL